MEGEVVLTIAVFRLGVSGQLSRSRQISQGKWYKGARRPELP